MGHEQIDLPKVDCRLVVCIGFIDIIDLTNLAKMCLTMEVDVNSRR